MPSAKKNTAKTQPIQSSEKKVSLYSFASLINFVNNNFVLIFLGGLLFIAGFFMGSLWTENNFLRSGSQLAAGVPTGADQLPAELNLSDQVPAVTDKDHVLGNRNAKVILVEYSDYECPFCGRFHPTMQQAKTEYGDDVAWVYRHFPLSIHPNAQKSAEGAECVAKLGGDAAFWKYSDDLFAVNIKDGKLSPQAIQDAATKAGVNLTQFNNCLNSGEMAEVVKQHQDGGTAAGVNGTPGTIVITKDGGQELISGAVGLAEIKATVDSYLK